MKILKYTKKIIKKFLLNLLFPAHCLGCGRNGDWLCAKCSASLAGFSIDRVNRDQLIIPNLDKIYIAGNYENPLLAQLIKKFKYDFLFALGDTLGRRLADYWSRQLWLWPNLKANEILLVPIPLSKERYHWRGFNQAEILTRYLGREFGYEVSSALTKINHTAPQAELSEEGRLTNMAGCLCWTGGDLQSQTVIIIDDVVTTGATLNEAALCLRQAGAKKIYGLVLAKG